MESEEQKAMVLIQRWFKAYETEKLYLIMYVCKYRINSTKMWYECLSLFVDYVDRYLSLSCFYQFFSFLSLLYLHVYLSLL